VTALVKLLRSTAFKLTLAILCLSAVGAALVLAAVAWQVTKLVDDETRQTIEAEASGLSEQYQTGGVRRLGLIIEGLFRNYYGSSGLPYQVPDALRGGRNLGFMFLPNYRAWVIVLSLAVCLATWFAIERTRLGSYLRAATENPVLVRAFGINVPRMVTLTYGFGVGLAALAGVMAAPIYNVSPQMGSDLIIVVFAVVVIGGMGSIMGAILTGFALGIVEGLTKVFYPEASNTVIFVIMAIVLLIRPSGLFGRSA